MYTKIFSLLAWLIFLYGVITFLMGLSIATGLLIEPEQGRYLGGKTSGWAMDFGLYSILVAMIMGMLAKISNSLEKLLNKNDKEQN